MRKGIIVAIAGLALLAGCKTQGDKGPNAAADPKWKGEPYRLAFDTQASKPNAAGITIPAVKFTANPEALETRAILVVRFEASGPEGKGLVSNHMIGTPVDIHGAEGTLPADYMEMASKGLSNYLADYCIAGKVKISVALVRSSINPHAGDAEVDEKRLSDWLPAEVAYKNAHPHC